jgi:mono/diheme cytochrome c family protein
VKLAIVIGLLATACDNGGSTPDWSRMIDQPKLLPYGETADGFTMRAPPDGVIARDWTPEPPADLADIPVPITRELLDRGRARFTTVCAACHGVAGDGNSAVASNMQRRRPASLHEPRIVALRPGFMYRVITVGYGLMPSLASLVSKDDRWAVIAYVRTLELAWTARLDRLPSEIRADTIRRLP